MSFTQKLSAYIGSPHKLQKIGNKIKNIPYDIRCRRLVSYVKNTPPVYGLNQTERRGQKIIVSLTSYPARFPSIGLCLKSLLLQSVKPDKIMLWLDCEESAVTAEMKAFERFGVEIICGVEDLKPHKKYFFSMQQYPDDIVITVDDDVMYPRDTLESLLKKHKQYPDCVCARRAHKVTFSDDGKIKPYTHWLDKYKREQRPSLFLIPTGIGGGTLSAALP